MYWTEIFNEPVTKWYAMPEIGGRPEDDINHTPYLMKVPPLLKIDPRFENVHTVMDLTLEVQRQVWPSPIGFTFLPHEHMKFDEIFYTERYGRSLHFHQHEPSRKIYATDIVGEIMAVVASSLPEFLTRVDLENKLWYHSIAGTIPASEIPAVEEYDAQLRAFYSQ